MKLGFAKLISNLPAIVLVLLLGGIVLYFSIIQLLDSSIDKVLHLRKEYAIRLIDESNENSLLKSKFAHVYRLSKIAGGIAQGEQVKDTLIYDSLQNRYLSYRELNFIHCKNKNCYHVAVREAVVEDRLIQHTIFTHILIICLAMAVVLFILNIFIARRIWQPFYATLYRLSDFSLEGSGNFVTTRSGIVEFKRLNSTLDNITSRLKTEYNDLKSFTSFLTHEMQTPLAVIKAHTDVLLRNENLDEEQIKSMITIRNMCDSISRSEEALIFLKRIELGEFNDSEKLNFSELLHQKLEQTEELVMLKKIHLKAEIDDDIWLTLHPQLAEALLNNIISNCIRHNHTGGRIYIVLHKDFFHAHNSLPGKQEKPQAQTGFITSKGLGVGLSIVQSICSRYKYKVRFGEKSNGTFRLDIEF